MSSATTRAPPMTRIHSRTARPTRLGGAAGTFGDGVIVGRRAPGAAGSPMPAVPGSPGPGSWEITRAPYPATGAI